MLTDWYWALVAVLFGVVWALLGLARGPARVRLLRAYVVFAAAALLLLAPLLAGMWLARDQLPMGGEYEEARWQQEVQGFSADALGLLFPALGRWRSYEQTMALLERLNPAPYAFGPEGWYVAAGWTLLALAALGVGVGWRRHWPLLVAGLAMGLLSLGPALMLAGRDTGLPMPYAWLQNLPLVGTGRRPSHFAALCSILAVPFAALGLQRLLEPGGLRRSPALRAGVLLGIAALAALELWPAPWATANLARPAFLAQLSERPGAVADLPYEQRWTSRALRNQLVHGQPILGGYVARRPAYASLRDVPLLRQVAQMAPATGDIVPLAQADLAVMQCYYRLRHVLLDKSQARAENRQGLEAALAQINGAPLAPWYEDAAYAAYELPLFEDRCKPFVYPGAGWHSPEQSAARRWRWASEASTIWVVNPGATAMPAVLSLTAESRAPATPAELWQGARLLARWSVARAARSYSVPLLLPPGATRLTLVAEAAPDARSARRISLAVTALEVK